MSENQNNPLKAFFRKPGIWIKLPSQGKFYHTPLAELNAQGEIPVFPMTAKDEILLKNADALLNGSAIRHLIESCVPCIKDIDGIPAIDLDAILVAIRRATYGEKFEMSTECACDTKTTTEFVVNLDAIISSIKVIDEIKPIVMDDGIKVYVHPVNIKSLLNLNWIQFEQMRNLQLADQKGMSEDEQLKLVNASYDILLNTSIQSVADCIDEVLMPDLTVVTHKEHIREWATQLARPEFKKLEENLLSLSDLGINKKINVQCANCDKQYEATIDLNPTTFFG